RAGRDVRHDPARRPAYVRQPGRRAGRLAEHLHPRPVRAVFPGPAGHDRRRPAPDTGQQRGGDEPVRDRPCHRLRRGGLMTTIRTVAVAGAGPVDVTVSEYGDGQPFLLLHGGGGPDTVTGFAELFAKTHHVRVIVPTHPGFGGTARPGSLT